MVKNVVARNDWPMYEHGLNDFRSYPKPPPVSGGASLSLVISTPGRIGFYCDYSELSDAGTHTFYICRTHGTAGTVSVNYSTAGDTHTAVSDTLTWLDGEADIKTVTVPVSASDLSVHAAAGLGEHRIILSLSNPLGGAVLHVNSVDA